MGGGWHESRARAEEGAAELLRIGRLVSPEPNHFQIVPFGTRSRTGDIEVTTQLGKGGPAEDIHGAIALGAAAQAPSPTAAPIDGETS